MLYQIIKKAMRIDSMSVTAEKGFEKTLKSFTNKQDLTI